MGFRFQAFPLYAEIRTFVKEIYQLSKKYPKKEQFELTSQLRRAASSVDISLDQEYIEPNDYKIFVGC